MAELGVAAGVVGLISFGIQVAQGILQYYDSYKDQDRKVASMCTSVDSLRRTLAVLSDTLQKHDPLGKSKEEIVVQSVNQVNITMKRLDDELKTIENSESPKPGLRAAIRRQTLRMYYPFNEKTLQEIQNAVSEARSNLSLTLDVLQMLVYLGLISLVLSQIDQADRSPARASWTFANFLYAGKKVCAACFMQLCSRRRAFESNAIIGFIAQCDRNLPDSSFLRKKSLHARWNF
jgi:hypothetical protein